MEQSGIEPGSAALEVDALTTWPTRAYKSKTSKRSRGRLKGLLLHVFLPGVIMPQVQKKRVKANFFLYLLSFLTRQRTGLWGINQQCRISATARGQLLFLPVLNKRCRCVLRNMEQ